MAEEGVTVEIEARGQGTYRGVLGTRPFGALLAAFGGSALGQSLGAVAVTVAVYDRTGSTAWVAAAAASRFVPYLLCSSLSGVVADHCDRRRVLIASLTGRAALAGLTAFAISAGAAPAVIVSLSALLVAVGTPCYPTVAAVVPGLVDRAGLTPANALVTMVEASGFLVGPALGGALLHAGPAAVMLLDALVLLAALVPLLSVPLLPAPSRDGRDGWRRELTAGLRAVAASRSAAGPFVLGVTVNFVYGGALVALVLVARHLHIGATGYGVLNAAFGLGALAGVVLTNRLARSALPATACLVCGASVALLAVARHAGPAVVLLMISGGASVVTEVIAVGAIQKAVPSEVLARVFGFYDTAVVGAVFLGSVLAPAVLHVVGLEVGLVLLGGAVPLVAVALVRGLGRQPGAQPAAASTAAAREAATAGERMIVSVTMQATPSAATSFRKPWSASSITSAPATSR